MRSSESYAAALTLAVGLLTFSASARADSDLSFSAASPGMSATPVETTQATPSPAESATESPTPLTLHSSHPPAPLQFSDESSSATLGWKVVAVAALIGALIYGLRRRSLTRPTNTDLVIVRRASVGFRSELLVVNVDGQRLLLGVTPQSIHTLALLDNADDLTSAASSASDEPPTLGSRVGSMLDAIEEVRASDSSTKTSSTPTDNEIPGQARGLMSLRRRR